MPTRSTFYDPSINNRILWPVHHVIATLSTLCHNNAIGTGFLIPRLYYTFYIWNRLTIQWLNQIKRVQVLRLWQVWHVLLWNKIKHAILARNYKMGVLLWFLTFSLRKALIIWIDKSLSTTAFSSYACEPCSVFEGALGGACKSVFVWWACAGGELLISTIKKLALPLFLWLHKPKT